MNYTVRKDKILIVKKEFETSKKYIFYIYLIYIEKKENVLTLLLRFQDTEKNKG